jgi:hypothetical protein
MVGSASRISCARSSEIETKVRSVPVATSSMEPAGSARMAKTASICPSLRPSAASPKDS